MLAEDGSDVQELLLDDIVIPDVGLGSGQWLTSEHVHSEGLALADVCFLDLNKSILGVESGVHGKGSWDDKKGVGESLDTELGLSRNFLGTGPLEESLTGSDLERSSTWKDTLILDGVLDGSETITDGVLGLSNGVVVGSLDEDGAREGVGDALNEGVLVVTERLLVDELSVTEIGVLDIVDGVDLLATAGERDSLTVSALGTSDSNDVVASEDLEGRRVNTLLVDNDEVFVGTITQSLLELDNLHDTVVSELSLGLDELLSLVGVAPEESGVDLGLFVLEGDVEAHDVTVGETAWHVALATTVIEDETADEARLSGHLVLHVHDLDHMEINTVVSHDGLDGINADFGKRVGDGGVDLGVEGSAGDLHEHVTRKIGLLDSEGIEESEALALGLLEAVSDDTGVDTLAEVALSLTHELTNEEDVGGGAVADDIILGGSGTADHGGGGVLDLHLVEENTAILGKFDLSGATDEPKFE